LGNIAYWIAAQDMTNTVVGGKLSGGLLKFYFQHIFI
jgi:hypothetical protein